MERGREGEMMRWRDWERERDERGIDGDRVKGRDGERDIWKRERGERERAEERGGIEREKEIGREEFKFTLRRHTKTTYSSPAH